MSRVGAFIHKHFLFAHLWWYCYCKDWGSGIIHQSGSNRKDVEKAIHFEMGPCLSVDLVEPEISVTQRDDIALDGIGYAGAFHINMSIVYIAIQLVERICGGNTESDSGRSNIVNIR
jgi:hypothetical protein